MSEFLKSNFDIDLAEMVKGRSGGQRVDEPPPSPAKN